MRRLQPDPHLCACASGRVVSIQLVYEHISLRIRKVFKELCWFARWIHKGSSSKRMYAVSRDRIHLIYKAPGTLENNLFEVLGDLTDS